MRCARSALRPAICLLRSAHRHHRKRLHQEPFLDDKLSAAILLAYAKMLRDENRTPKRRVTCTSRSTRKSAQRAAASVPDDVTEVLSVDMGCVGDGVTCTEHEVSICAK